MTMALRFKGSYVIELKNGAKIIHETDDDNIPYDNFYDDVPSEIEIDIYKSEKWINVYSLFSKVFFSSATI